MPLVVDQTKVDPGVDHHLASDSSGLDAGSLVSAAVSLTTVTVSPPKLAVKIGDAYATEEQIRAAFALMLADKDREVSRSAWFAKEISTSDELMCQEVQAVVNAIGIKAIGQPTVLDRAEKPAMVSAFHLTAERAVGAGRANTCSATTEDDDLIQFTEVFVGEGNACFNS